MANLDRAIVFKQLDRLYRDGTFTAQSDGQLLDQYLNSRDEAAFEAIVNLHGPMVLALCRRFLRDPRDIEDAFQATFLVLARKAASIRKREVLSSWLYGVAYRVAVRSRSEVLRRRSVETGVPVLDDSAGAAAREADDIGPVLDQELNRLPEKYRAPIVLCYLKDQTHDQAAAQLQWPVGTVRSRLARGRELLKDRLTRRGCSPATAMLIGGPTGSIGSFTAAVPQPLVQATVESASRFLWGASSSIVPGALAISTTSSPSLSGAATTLAQGVLLTMSLSQIKFVAAGVTAVSLLAGGLGAGAWALGPPGQGQGVPAPTPPKPAAKPGTPDSGQNTDLPTPHLASTTPPPSAVEARLADLERKLDLLLQRFNSPPIPQPALDPLPPPRQEAPQTLPAARPAETNRNPFDIDQQPAHPGRRAQPQPQPLNPGSYTPPLATVDPGFPDVESPPADRLQPARRSRPPVDLQPVLPSPSSEQPPQPAARLPQAPEGAALTPEPLQPASDVGNTPALAQAPEGALLGPEPLQPAVKDASLPPRPRERTDPFESPDRSRSSLREIEAQIQIARHHFERNKPLYAAAAIGKQAYEEPLDQIRLLVARLEGMEDDLADEIERLKVETVKKHAQLKLAEAGRSSTQVALASTRKLVAQKAVSTAELSLFEAKDTAALAQVEVQGLELQDVELRLRQASRRREIIKRDVAETLKAIPEIAREHGPAADAGDLPLRTR